jgi:hypothetical protein
MPREDITKALLTEQDIPTAWYNLLVDLPGDPAPPLHPGTMQPVGPADLAPLFPESLIAQEVSSERYIDIPGAVLDVYRQWRPSPLHRARRLEANLGLSGKPRRRGRTSPTLRYHRPTSTRRPVSLGWRRKRGPASGGPRLHMRARSSGSNASFSWSRCLTTKSLIAAF